MPFTVIVAGPDCPMTARQRPRSIAVGDSFVQQIVGHGLAARLSAKLGEGVVNGMMTARIGIAAMETVRPLPFTAVRRPGMGDFLAALTSFASGKDGKNDAKS